MPPKAFRPCTEVDQCLGDEFEVHAATKLPMSSVPHEFQLPVYVFAFPIIKYDMFQQKVGSTIYNGAPSEQANFTTNLLSSPLA